MTEIERGHWAGYFFIFFVLFIFWLCWFVKAVSVKRNRYDESRGLCVFMTFFFSLFLIPMTIYASYHLGPKAMECDFGPIVALTVPAWSLPLAVIYSLVAGAYFHKHVQLPAEEPHNPYDAEYVKDNTGGAIIIATTWGIWVPIKLAYLILKPVCIFLFKATWEVIELSVATYEVIDLHRREKKMGVPPVVKKEYVNEY